MPKCIVCGYPVNERELRECEKEQTNGIYCGSCLSRLVNNCTQSAFQTSCDNFKKYFADHLALTLDIPIELIKDKYSD
jgi:hypothetical protein